MSKDGAYLKAKGRTRDSRHVRLYAWLTSSAAWRDLSGNAVKLLVYLAGWEDGSNNGELFMSERMAAEAIGVSKRTAGKLFDELEEHGFIRATAKGYFSVKRGPATSWRLTWQSWPAASKGPSHEYRDWKPGEQNRRAQSLHATGAKVAPVTTAHRSTGEKIAPINAEEPQKCVERVGAIIAPHTIATGEGLSGAVPNCSDHPVFELGEAENKIGPAPDELLRDKIIGHWLAVDSHRRRAWASGNGLSLDELRDYVIGSCTLPFPKQVALWSAAKASGAAP